MRSYDCEQPVLGNGIEDAAHFQVYEIPCVGTVDYEDEVFTVGMEEAARFLNHGQEGPIETGDLYTLMWADMLPHRYKYGRNYFRQETLNALRNLLDKKK